MLDLIAQGPLPGQRWRRPLPEPASGREVSLGRSDSDWNVPWDAMISRKHVRLIAMPDKQLEVIRNLSARNPVYYRGSQSQHFKIAIGEHFVIGETTFTFANRPGVSHVSIAGPVASTRQLTEHAFDQAELRGRNFRDTASRINVLSRLPDLITSSGTDEELLVRMTNVLLQSTPSATSVAVVAIDAAKIAASEPPAQVQVLHYDSRQLESDSTSVSATLARTAIESNESVLQIWSNQAPSPVYTSNEGVDWAFCVPLRSEACRGWAIYVIGQFSPETYSITSNPLQSVPDELQDDLKFAELVGSMVANLRQSHRLERRQASMRQFFAPLVMDALAGRDPEQVLAPRETDLTVMFCDLRGFSRHSEQQSDALMDLLSRVSESLGLMTRAILDTGGVIGDFHGDAAMGFWGWPLPQTDCAARAARAAVQIRLRQARSLQPGITFQHGIGIATGRAVAGQIGTVDQVKVTAFGPVVNLASRLEGLTKAFGVNVILDKATADAIRQSAAAEVRLRYLARVRPAGFTLAADVFELMSPDTDPSADVHLLSDDDINRYEDAIQSFLEGQWSVALPVFQSLSSRDRASQLVVNFILRHRSAPPEDWSGAIDFVKNPS
ncbi:adenylate/guanylate cyclase domain-containing protein [Novipirellula artificiosorum]|uniref:Adenylate cyclase 2 n=1 Tax=Novipirellula artificiosorum TaxID=2528016 RepID=A0A5C6D7X3_9BACT|nr:adenylate/guanylate cyclase domain-containing protein [Novipirellula artificiosorum]TWU33293.1 Adenylate cyclase 2 [Novipirellula artificiosorum]